MGQSEIGINVDLDPNTPWWETLVKILAVVIVGIGIITFFILNPRLVNCNMDCYKNSRNNPCYY